MSANACSPGWLRSSEHFLPSCDVDAVSLPPWLLLSVKSSKTCVRGLPVVTYDDHETDYRETTGATSHSWISFWQYFRYFPQDSANDFVYSLLVDTCPLGMGVFCPRVSLSCFIPSRCIDTSSLGLRSLRSSPGPFFFEVDFAFVTFTPWSGFTLALVRTLRSSSSSFSSFLPFVNAPGEIHRGEMVFGPWRFGIDVPVPCGIRGFAPLTICFLCLR